MKISLLNPNSSKAVSATMAEAVADMAKVAGCAIDVATLAVAPIGIESDADVAFVTPLVADFVKATSADAYVIGCFSDPGVVLARQVTASPVIGIGEAAYREASAEGRAFGVVSLGPASVARHKQAINDFGLSKFLVADLPINLSVAEANSDEAAQEEIFHVGMQLTRQGAGALVLACAGMAHHCAVLEKKLGCPVIDPVQAGVRAAFSSLDIKLKLLPSIAAE